MSLNAPLPRRDQGERVDYVPFSSASSEEKLEAHQLRAMVKKNAGRFGSRLNERENDILERRILAEQPLTLKKLGNRHGVPRERIREVKGRIIKRFRT